MIAGRGCYLGTNKRILVKFTYTHCNRNTITRFIIVGLDTRNYLIISRAINTDSKLTFECYALKVSFFINSSFLEIIHINSSYLLSRHDDVIYVWDLLSQQSYVFSGSFKIITFKVLRLRLFRTSRNSARKIGIFYDVTVPR